MERKEKHKENKKKENDPEMILKRKFRAKCRFRALVRLALANAYWLIEDIDYEGDDVKRRVEQVVRGRKKKQLLATADKALLNKPAAWRTEQEKKYIYRIIGGLKCFKRYPNNVKRKLAACTYFLYYGPNRVIMRHHHPPLSMCFIVTGKVSVTRLVYDELLKEDVPVEIAQLGPGDMFGEVSLLHDIPRTATATTTEHCEFLTLLGDDFKNVLQSSIQLQWDEVKEAMSSFTYFDALDEVDLREGCIIAKLKVYQPNQTILGDGHGVPNHVYFILSGSCQMIESLRIYVTTFIGHTYYTLLDPHVSPEQSELDLDKKYFLAYKIQNKSRESAVRSSRSQSLVGSRGSVERRRSHMHKQDDSNKYKSSVQVVSSQKRLSQIAQKRNSQSKSAGGTSAAKLNKSKNELKSQQISNSQMKSDTKRTSTERKISIEEGKDSNMREGGGSQTKLESRDILTPHDTETRDRPSIRFSAQADDFFTKVKNLKTYFMQVCQFNPGACFGLGENMRDRRIVALTEVYCLLLPKVWLLQKNTANIWTRIQHYLERKIPTKRQLFEEFVKQRQWEDYRDMVVEDVVDASNAVNYTSVHDVPYSIRLEEMGDIKL